MSTKPDGGPAFPRTSHEWGTEGMSLRDYFAGQALHSLYFDTKLADDKREASGMAALAYLVADAMLTKRGKE